MTDIIGEIRAATSEQSQGIEQVNTAVNQLDQMTQQNSALVEESSAAADSLREQALKLTEVVALFRVNGSSASTPRPPAPPAPARAPAARAATTLPKAKAPAVTARPPPPPSPQRRCRPRPAPSPPLKTQAIGKASDHKAYATHKKSPGDGAFFVGNAERVQRYQLHSCLRLFHETFETSNPQSPGIKRDQLSFS